MGFGDAQVGQEKGNGFGAHGGAAVGVKGELSEGDVLFEGGVADQTFGQLSALPQGHHPAGDIAAEDIEDDIEIEIGPLGGAMEFGDIPGPELIGSGGEEFGFGIDGMLELVAAFTDLTVFNEDAVHGAQGTDKGALIEQSGVDLGGGLIDEARAIEGVEHLLLFVRGEGAWGRGPGRRRFCGRVFPAVEGGPGDIQSLAQGLDGDIAAGVIDGT